MIGALEDLRYSLRALGKARGFTMAAVLSLGLGIGANTTIFTLLNAVLLRPLPVEAPERLVAVGTLDARNPGLWPCSYPNYKDYRDHNQVLSSLLLYSAITLNLTGFGEPQLVAGQIVSGNYFAALGVNPVVGRGFLPEEDASPGAYPVVVIGYGLWTRQFGRDPQVTARTIILNGRAYSIVGVAPPAFQGLNELTAADVWVPMMMYQEVYPNAAWVNQRRFLLFSVVGRLKAGVSVQQAEAGMESIAQDLERQYPQDNQGRRVKLTPVSEAAISPQIRPVITSAGTVLMIISALVLLIACANVANLLLARAAGRGKEITVRLALGASRWRLIRQLLTESTLLALAGGAAGLVLARWARDILWSMRPPMFTYAGVRLDLDGRVLGYTLAISVLTGMVFGLAPALRATSGDLASDLKERTGPAESFLKGRRARSVLVMGQVALSVVALVGAGLFVRSLRNADRIDPGFDAARLGVVAFNVGDQGYNEGRGREFERQALERASAVPGVVSATLAKDVPFHVSLARTVLLEGQEDTAAGKGRFTLMSVVWPGYLRTVGIPILRGRDFSLLDTATAPRVVMVNEAAAMAYWRGENPIGKRIRFFGDNAPAEVVGVARNANYQAIGERPQALIYGSLIQYYFPTAVLYVRTGGDPEAVSAAVRREVQRLDRNLLLQSESIGGIMRESLWTQRMSAGLLGVFGGLALVLAAVGIYGVVSYSVNRRVREIGVRMALGATPAEVQRLILTEGIRLVATGVLAGMAIALSGSRAVEGMLFATSPYDAATFVLVPTILALVAVLACWLPAVRATRIDPAAALREE
ncbi:MAG: ABC transporter permease [Bryobacteraceae bacterium]|jgi:predicted permease